MKDHEYSWRKAKASAEHGGGCVVLAVDREGNPAVSDSKLEVGARPVMPMGRDDHAALLSFASKFGA